MGASMGASIGPAIGASIGASVAMGAACRSTCAVGHDRLRLVHLGKYGIRMEPHLPAVTQGAIRGAR